MVAQNRDAVFDRQFLEDLTYFIANDRKLALRLLELIQAILRDPFGGIGKPEPLKRLGANTWSRRLNDEHRVIHVVKQNAIQFVQTRYHY